jgi:hypothetical protein
MTSTFKTFCIAVIKHHQTDSDQSLATAMKLRNELIRSGEFNSEFLDGLVAGLTGSLHGH